MLVSPPSFNNRANIMELSTASPLPNWSVVKIDNDDSAHDPALTLSGVDFDRLGQFGQNCR